MALKKEFERKLEKLFLRRTSWLRQAIGKKRPGPPHIFNRKRVESALAELLVLAEEILVKERGRRQFVGTWDKKSQWHVKRGKGFGISAKQKTFRKWYDKKIGNNNCVYVFWAKRKAIYVGRTENGKGRPAGWFDRAWFQPATRIDIYSVKRKSVVPMAECLATHLFKPTENKNSSSTKKYAKKCPIHKASKEIREEVKSIFRLRK